MRSLRTQGEMHKTPRRAERPYVNRPPRRGVLLFQVFPLLKPTYSVTPSPIPHTPKWMQNDDTPRRECIYTFRNTPESEMTSRMKTCLSERINPFPTDPQFIRRECIYAFRQPPHRKRQVEWGTAAKKHTPRRSNLCTLGYARHATTMARTYSHIAFASPRRFPAGGNIIKSRKD